VLLGHQGLRKLLLNIRKLSYLLISQSFHQL
jgi:hypothetical protein